jgi:hypothetical protein
VSLDALLVDDLQLWRDTETGRDAFNQPIVSTALVDVALGRVFTLSTIEQRFSVEGTRAIVKQYRAIVEYRAELESVLDERTTIVDDDSGVYDVLEVHPARGFAEPHHFELRLEKVSA